MKNMHIDYKCDRQERFWFGSICPGKTHGRLYSPDQKIFYLTDSEAQKIYAYDFDVVTGKISDRTFIN